mmetsp:Transcript_5661/g.17640  ORF Transcript_5661/g.17640 Transcript_5661/m.17640 type:complete len:149 (+) Transcript_5661:49-495(+)|eukprot:scaffold60180_cov30-Tisochrysis_lutea.AAC.1
MDTAQRSLSSSAVLGETHKVIKQEIERIFLCLENDVGAMVQTMQSLAADLDGRIEHQHKRLAAIAAEKRRCQTLLGQLQGLFGSTPDSTSGLSVSTSSGHVDPGEPILADHSSSINGKRNRQDGSPRSVESAMRSWNRPSPEIVEESA